MGLTLRRWHFRGEKSLGILYNVMQRAVGGHDQRAYSTGMLKTMLSYKAPQQTGVQDTIHNDARTFNWNSKVPTYSQQTWFIKVLIFCIQIALKLVCYTPWILVKGKGKVGRGGEGRVASGLLGDGCPCFGCSNKQGANSNVVLGQLCTPTCLLEHCYTAGTERVVIIIIFGCCCIYNKSTTMETSGVWADVLKCTDFNFVFRKFSWVMSVITAWHQEFSFGGIAEGTAGRKYTLPHSIAEVVSRRENGKRGTIFGRDWNSRITVIWNVKWISVNV